ncbi:unnamed protein product [Allacma fusca]|uniref:Uncharacterized protein n=1 Tax=Allacma fusca TaxID=39272 RepID=A0A8J2L631_9HEXA|nr:unnamed protein product [Allacma fusca]
MVLDSASIDDTLDNSSMPPEVNDDTTTEIRDFHGSNLKLARSDISALKTMSPSITFVVRNKFRRAFSTEEIIGHSLLGRKRTAQSFP